MKDNKLELLFERARRQDTPEEERRTSAVLVLEELARRGASPLGAWSGENSAEVLAVAKRRVIDLEQEIEVLRIQLRQRAEPQERGPQGHLSLDMMVEALKENAYIEVFESRTLRRRSLATRLVPKPRSPIDRVRMALAEYAAIGNDAPSDREVARIAVLSPTTVGKLRRELGPVPDVRRGHDGKLRKTTKKK
jgi:hypothetical protein